MSTVDQGSRAGRLVPPLLVGLLLSLFALWDLKTAPPRYPVLDTHLTALHQQFNADRGRVRLLLILDPT